MINIPKILTQISKIEFSSSQIKKIINIETEYGFIKNNNLQEQEFRRVLMCEELPVTQTIDTIYLVGKPNEQQIKIHYFDLSINQGVLQNKNKEDFIEKGINLDSDTEWDAYEDISNIISIFEHTYLQKKLLSMVSELRISVSRILVGNERNSNIKRELKQLTSLAEESLNQFNNCSQRTKKLINKYGRDKNRHPLFEINIKQHFSIHLECFKYLFRNLPKDVGGKKEEILKKEILFKLISIYENGTNKRPTCGRDILKKTYVGDFYNFVEDIKNILEDFDISLFGKSIGQHTIDAIKKYKDVKNSLTSID